MAAASAGDVEGPASRAVAAVRNAVHRLVVAIDRHPLACGAAGVVVLAVLAWYVVWDVRHESFLFASNYAGGFQHLGARVAAVNRVRGGGAMYPPGEGRQYFVYPPAAIWLFWPLSWFATIPGERLWTFASLLALAWMIAAAGRYACRWRWPTAWAVSLLVAAPLSAIVFVPIGVHLALGQVGLLLAAMATFDLLCVRNRARGLLTGVTAALKLYPIVYFAIFALRREWRALGNAVAGLVVTTGVAWLVFPSDSATFFFHRLLSGEELRHYWHNDHWISSSSSLYTVLFRTPFTGSAPERAVGLALCIGVLALGVAAAWRQLAEGREVGAFLCVALASTIGSPVSWDHYFVWVVLVPFALVERGPLPWWRTAALSLFALTCMVPLRLARNESLSHQGYGGTFVVILAARDALIATSLLWLVVALVPTRAREPAAQSSAASTASHQPLSAG